MNHHHLALLLFISLGLCASTSADAQSMPIESGTDVTLDPNSGYLRLGRVNALNTVYDENEIQARSNGNPSTLFLNNEGGGVAVKEFTRLGNGAPYIQTRYLTGTVAADWGISIPSSIPMDKIVSAYALIQGQVTEIQVWTNIRTFIVPSLNQIILDTQDVSDTSIEYPAAINYRLFLVIIQ